MLGQRVTVAVLYNKTDISADLATFLKQLNYTDNLSGEADTLDLMLEDRAGLWQSTWFPDKGAMLDVTVNTLNWGALYGGAASLRLGQFEVDELTSSGYPSEVQIRSVSIPSNNKLRGVERTRSWEKAELKTIANDVASGAGMELVFDTQENPKLERTEQAQQSDLSFLLALTKDHGLALKVHDNKVVIFDEADYEKKEPQITIVKPGTFVTPEAGKAYITEILGYSMSNKNRDIYKACHVRYQKSKKKAIVEATFTDQNKKDGKTLEVREQVETVADAERLAKKRLREKNKEEWTASFSLMGNLNLIASSTIALSGFGVFDGNYLIVRATHSIGSGYHTNIEIRRCLDGY